MIKPITLQIDADVADASNQASSSKQRAMQTIVSLWLKQMVKPDSLEAITQEIRQEGASNSLTATVLEDLLGDKNWVPQINPQSVALIRWCRRKK